MVKILLICLAIMVVAPCYGAEINSFSPWDFNTSNQSGIDKRQAVDASPGGTLLIGVVKFYQIYLSSIIGGHCPSYPTCSAYSIEATRKHGFFIGYAMTIDRLIHEDSEMEVAPLIKVGDSLRYYDPVSNNNFWWYH